MPNPNLNNLKQNAAERARDLAIWSIYHAIRGAETARRWYYSIPQEQRLAGMVLGTVFGGGFLTGFMSGHWYYSGPAVPHNVLPADAMAVYQLPRLSAPMNLLVLGTGSETGGALPGARHGDPIDMLWLFNIDPQRRRLNVISIPSDTLVEIPNQGFAKIKYASQSGGTDLTKALVEKTLGISVDRYLRLDMNTAEQVIEAMGGMDMYVERNLQYVDHAGHTNIDLQKGWQPLSGHQAMGYLRFRFDNLGEIGRIRRQQRFVHLILQKMLQPSAIGKLPMLATLGRKLVDTDLGSRELNRLIGTLGTISVQDVRMAILPGTFGPSTNWSSSHNLWLPDRHQIDSLVARLTGPDAGHRFIKGQTVSLLTTVTDRRLNDLVVQHLIEQGFRVAHLFHVKPTTFPNSQIIDRTFTSSSAALDALRTVLPNAQLNVGDDGTAELQTDYAVVLGTDYAPALTDRHATPSATSGAEMAVAGSEILTSKH